MEITPQRQFTRRSTAFTPPSSFMNPSAFTTKSECSLPSHMATPELPLELDRISLRSSTNMVHSLFGIEFGVCWGDYFCSHGRIRGRLYAVTNGILFYSNLLGFERRLCVQFADVTSMSLHRTTSIRINVSDSDAYIFRSFHYREDVLLLLTRLKYLVERKRTDILNKTALIVGTAQSHTECHESDSFVEWERRQIEYEDEWRNFDLQMESSPMISGLHPSLSLSNFRPSVRNGMTLPNRRRAVSDSVIQSLDVQVDPIVANKNDETAERLTVPTLIEMWNSTSQKLSSIGEVGILVRSTAILRTFFNKRSHVCLFETVSTPPLLFGYVLFSLS
jgi:hypothetical protein